MLNKRGKYEKKSWALITRTKGNLSDSKRNNKILLSFSLKVKRACCLEF